MSSKQSKGKASRASRNPRPKENQKRPPRVSKSEKKKPAGKKQRQPAGKKQRQPARRPPHKTLSIPVVILAGAVAGWFIGSYGPATWPLITFSLAAVWGLWYPAQLERSLDQHKNIARQVGEKTWNGFSKNPLADIATGLLLMAWIVLLGLSINRYPLPQLLNSTLGSLCSSFGIILRSGFTAWRKGVPTVPYEIEPLEKTIKIAGNEENGNGRLGVFWIALVILQAAAGQIMLGGTFGHVLIGPVQDLTLGAVLLSASGAEIVLLLVRHRLQSAGERARSLRKAMK